ncbi:MAG: sigma 54-interacting transcriptional regulator [Sedimentibacter sp.]|uniref:sigma-54 interaction domain-containing protein n=1 Tax=Sedimentibacter sp. TaxID=1960295 RepID=UPI002982881D|nr:sigma 54-interacting transcriptional regulator [Sedimentibacter sp.]MDW5299781.1 sigma 54-interacting transcriptional regulator [Sedimentibacter sp.]
MRSIAVVAMEKEYAKILADNIKQYFSEFARINYYSKEEVELSGKIEEELVIIATYTIYNSVKEIVNSENNIIVVTVTPTREKVKKLDVLKNGTRALLVNFDYRTCIQTITEIYGIGYSNLELIPYYGQEDYDKSVDVAITPNEARLVPSYIRKVIDIGESVIEYNSLFRIAERLNVSHEFEKRKGKIAKETTYYPNLDFDNILGENKGFTEKINALVDLMKVGVIITDATGIVVIENKNAKRIINNRVSSMSGFNISEIIPEIAHLIYSYRNINEEIVKINNETIIVSIVRVIRGNNNYGNIITIEKFSDAEDTQIGIRSKLISGGHTAHYTFEQIIGESREIKKCIDIAMHMAETDFSVVITGESGTGKELFAQSIHNASKRSKYNFVAVNCSAIPENLLESEMFGYEGGSFTGAKKEGRIGLFELAHKGTIFLDEIAEMPLLLQSKLLRVIEEKKIMKVGSNKKVDIDVRIISATNKNLTELVEKGEFREDLYYRIAVLPLKLPALRDRASDIPLLVRYLESVLGSVNLSENAEKILLRHRWKGNIRELRNVLEYLLSLKKKVVTEYDLPDNVISNKNTYNSAGKHNGFVNGEDRKFIMENGQYAETFARILNVLLIVRNEGSSVGRKKILDKLNSEGVTITEGEVRSCLSKLSYGNYVKSAPGRGGSCITDKGITLLENLKAWIK